MTFCLLKTLQCSGLDVAVAGLKVTQIGYQADVHLSQSRLHLAISLGKNRLILLRQPV